jgi:ribosomal protein RSM22 (predicted rRNA methylase)
MTLSALTPHLLYKFKSESDLIKAIEELSVKFTRERDAIQDYLSDERLTSAYTAFYLATNIPKFTAVMKWMPAEWINELKKSVLIDVGAGPGTFSIAFRQWLGSEAHQIIQLETSAMMRKQAELLWQGLFPDEKLLQFDRPMAHPSQELFMLFGHSANEMGVDEALRYIEYFNPQHILFIEPGTKDFFPKMLSIREKLIKHNYDVIFPCGHGAACPLNNSSTDWCHQFVQVKHDAELERLTQLVRKDRRNLPLTVHAFSQKKTINMETRVIRVLPETKFSFEWEVCHHNQIQQWQIMKRGLDRKMLNSISSVLAGDAVQGKTVKVLENALRVELSHINNHTLLT